MANPRRRRPARSAHPSLPWEAVELCRSDVSGSPTQPRTLGRGRLLAVVAAAGLAAVAIAAQDQWTWLLEDGSVQSDGAVAADLAVADDERLYVIGEGSTASYRIGERLAGAESTAVGSTDQIAGNIALNLNDPSLSRLGEMVVNIESLTSDSDLRDKRIRLDHLESQEHPLAVFVAETLSGLPNELVDGTSTGMTVTGELTVKEISAPVTFSGTVALVEDVLVADLSAEVLLSTYDAGPISIAGLVTTDDEAVIELHLEARPDDESPVLTGPDSVEPHPEGPFAETVQPIIEASCAGCHTGRGPGVSTVSFATAGEVAEVADGIALVTGAGYMPPWPASALSIEFEHDWSLSDTEIAAIAEWAEHGGGLDVPPDTPLTPSAQQEREIERDLVIAGRPYVGSEDHADDYRCQAYEWEDGARWIRGIGFEPDATEVVHHAVFFLADADELEAARELDSEDPEPGWACFGLGGLGARQVAAWAPGQQPLEFGDDTALWAEDGSFLVVQIHYHYDHDFPVDQSIVVLDTEPADAEFRSVDYETYLAPAEIPCTPDLDGPLCDRDAVIEEVRADFGEFAALIPNALIRRCGADLAADIADTDGVADAVCDLPIVNPGEIVSVFGHMHEIGSSIRMTINPDTEDEFVLLDIPTWSFEWQLNFTPTEQIVLEQGDVLRIECEWDRSLRPDLGARYVLWNEGTDDEMCYSAIATAEP